jgi:hypothetical protein
MISHNNREDLLPAIAGNQKLRLAYVMAEVEYSTNTPQSFLQAASKLHKPIKNWFTWYLEQSLGKDWTAVLVCEFDRRLRGGLE